MTSNKVPTNEQIMEEAKLRYRAGNVATAAIGDYKPVEHFIIEVVREGWTPPEPVDPDLLAWREWVCLRFPKCKSDIKAGWWDRGLEGQAYLAGARMAREQEQERANHPIAFAVRVMAGVFKDFDHAKREAGAALAKYRGEA